MSVCRQVVLAIWRLVDLGRGLLGRGLLQGGVDRHRDPDLPAQRDGERVLELAPEPALELGAGEVVGDGHDRRALVERHRLAGPQPRALVGLEVPQDAAPGRAEVRCLLLHASRLPPCLVVRSRSGPGLDWSVAICLVHRIVHRLCTWSIRGGGTRSETRHEIVEISVSAGHSGNV